MFKYTCGVCGEVIAINHRCFDKSIKTSGGAMKLPEIEGMEYTGRCVLADENEDHGYDEVVLIAHELKPCRLKPKNGEEYWFLDSRGLIKFDIWEDLPTDQDRYDFGNVHKTEADAEAYRDKVRAVGVTNE